MLDVDGRVVHAEAVARSSTEAIDLLEQRVGEVADLCMGDPVAEALDHGRDELLRGELLGARSESGDVVVTGDPAAVRILPLPEFFTLLERPVTGPAGSGSTDLQGSVQ